MLVSMHDVSNNKTTCKVCKKITTQRSKFYKPHEFHLIIAAQPIERLGDDFKRLCLHLVKMSLLLYMINLYMYFYFLVQ